METNEHLKIKKLIEQEKQLRGKRHEIEDLQIIASKMLFIFLEIPKWKVFSWYPIVRHLKLMERLHKKCCGFTLE